MLNDYTHHMLIAPVNNASCLTRKPVNAEMIATVIANPPVENGGPFYGMEEQTQQQVGFLPPSIPCLSSR